MKGARHRSTGISRGGHQHDEVPLIIAREPAHQAGHEPCSEVLEGEGGAMKEFENVHLLRDGHQRRIKIDRVRHHLPQGLLRHRARKD